MCRQFCYSAPFWATSSPVHNRGGLTLSLNSHSMSQGSSFPATLKQCLQVCAGKETNTYSFQICLVINNGNKKTSLSFQYDKIFLANSDRAIEIAAFFSVYPLQFFRSSVFVVKATLIKLDPCVSSICLNEAQVLTRVTDVFCSNQGEAPLILHLPWFQSFSVIFPELGKISWIWLPEVMQFSLKSKSKVVNKSENQW